MDVSELRAFAGEWTVVDAPQALAPAMGDSRQIRIEGRTLSVQSACDDQRLEAVIDRSGRVRVRSDASTCAADRDILAFVGGGPDFIPIDSRTAEMRRGRQRLRIRKV